MRQRSTRTQRNGGGFLASSRGGSASLRRRGPHVARAMKWVVASHTKRKAPASDERQRSWWHGWPAWGLRKNAWHVVWNVEGTGGAHSRDAGAAAVLHDYQAWDGFDAEWRGCHYAAGGRYAPGLSGVSTVYGRNHSVSKSATGRQRSCPLGALPVHPPANAPHRARLRGPPGARKSGTHGWKLMHGDIAEAKLSKGCSSARSPPTPTATPPSPNAVPARHRGFFGDHN